MTEQLVTVSTYGLRLSSSRISYPYNS